MNASDPAPAAWFERADHDLSAVEILIASPEGFWDIVIFHAQQAAEKYLKGFVLLKGGRPPKIHDLSRLLDLCLSHDATLSDLRTACIELTDAGYESRYPDVGGPLGGEEARTAVSQAKRICGAIRERVHGASPHSP